MANIQGTNIAAGIAPFTTDDTYATHDSKYGKGGWREVDTITERDSISQDRRSIGMAVHVLENQTVYTLKGGTTNDKWSILNLPSIDPYKSFIYEQALPSNRWEVSHKLGRYPSVTVVDSAGTTVEGDIQYIDNNNIVIEFSAPFTGKAYLS